MADVFRQKSLDRMKSPEQLDDYIRVSNPAAWMVLSAVILFLAGPSAPLSIDETPNSRVLRSDLE